MFSSASCWQSSRSSSSVKCYGCGMRLGHGILRMDGLCCFLLNGYFLGHVCKLFFDEVLVCNTLASGADWCLIGRIFDFAFISGTLIQSNTNISFSIPPMILHNFGTFCLANAFHQAICRLLNAEGDSKMCFFREWAQFCRNGLVTAYAADTYSIFRTVSELNNYRYNQDFHRPLLGVYTGGLGLGMLA